MHRTSRRRSLMLAGATMAALAAAPAAHAATLSVDAAAPAGCGGADTQCRTLAEAAAAASAGDTITIAPGTYQESVVFDDPGLTVRGAQGVAITGDPQAAAGTATVAFTGAGEARSVLERVLVLNLAAPAAAAVASTGTAGLVVQDALVASATGAGLRVTGSQRNLLQRSVVRSARPDGAAVEVVSDAAGDKALVADSTILMGGPDGAGLRATSLAGVPFSAAGDIAVVARHVTVAGSAGGIVVDSSAANGNPGLLGLLADPAGNIAATVTDSIVLGASGATSNPGGATSAPNTATLDMTRTETQAAPETLFADAAGRNYHLKPGAPVIDQGATTEGESPADVDGQPRVHGAASDLGADELHPSATPAPGTGTGTDALASGDVVPPFVQIRIPKRNQTLNLERTVTRTVTRRGKRVKVRRKVANRIRFTGRAADAAGVREVTLALQRVRLGGAKASQSERCTWVDPTRRKLIVRSCARPITFAAKLDGIAWSRTLPRTMRLRAGTYRLYASGTDANGRTGNAMQVKSHTFRLR